MHTEPWLPDAGLRYDYAVDTQGDDSSQHASDENADSSARDEETSGAEDGDESLFVTSVPSEIEAAPCCSDEASQDADFLYVSAIGIADADNAAHEGLASIHLDHRLTATDFDLRVQSPAPADPIQAEVPGETGPCSRCFDREAVRFCQGKGGHPCRFSQRYCSACVGDDDDHCVMCRDAGGYKRPPWAHRFKYCQECSLTPPRMKSLFACELCGRRVCVSCTILTEADLKLATAKKKRFRCFAHYEGGLAAACDAAATARIREVETLLTDRENKGSAKPTKEQLKTLSAFVRIFLALNKILLFDLVLRMAPLLERAQSLLKQHCMDSLISVSEAHRIHLPSEMHTALVLAVASHEAQCTDAPKGYDKGTPRKRLRKPEEKLAISCLLYDTKITHPIVQLLHDTLIYLLSRSLAGELEIYILALQKPASTGQPDTLLLQLHDAFAKQGLWRQVTPERVRPECLDLRVDLLLDLIGGQQGVLRPEHRPLPGVHAFCISHFLNQAWPMFNLVFYDYFIADKTMLKALPPPVGTAALSLRQGQAAPGGPAVEHEQTASISCWLPPLASFYSTGLASVPAASRNGSSDPLCVYVPMASERLDEFYIDLLLNAALAIHAIVLYFELNPIACTQQIDAMAVEFALKNNVDPDKFLREHIKFMPYFHLPDHVRRLRQHCHCFINGGHYPGHTSHATCCAALLPGVAIEGRDGDWGSGAWVPASVNEFNGLSALNVPFGPQVEMQRQVTNIIRQLADETTGIRRECVARLDKFNQEGLAFFNEKRVGDDILAFTAKVAHGGVGPVDGISARTCKHAPELLEVVEDGRLRVRAQQQAPEVARGANHCGVRRQRSEDQEAAQDSSASRRRHKGQGESTILPSSMGLECAAAVSLPASSRVRGPPPALAFYPHQFRGFPPGRPSDASSLKALTFNRFSPSTPQDILEKKGCVVVPPEVLMSHIPPGLLAEAKTFLHQSLFGCESPRLYKGFPHKLFLDGIRYGVAGVGDGLKSMSGPLKPGHVLRKVADELLDALMGQDMEVFGANLLFNRYEEPFSGKVPHCQAMHVDYHAHFFNQKSRGAGGEEFDADHMQQLTALDGSPISFLMNLSDEVQIFIVWIASHIIAIECNRFFAEHHAATYDCWTQQPENSGKGLDHFFLYWTDIVNAHLVKHFPQVALSPIQPTPVAVQPWGLVAVHGSTAHSGTSTYGLRLFSSGRLKRQALQRRGLVPRPFVTPQPAQADPAETSWVVAGMIPDLCAPLPVVNNPAGLEIVIRGAISEFLLNVLCMKGRGRVNSIVDWFCKSVHVAVADEKYQLNGLVVPIVADAGDTDAKSAALGAVIGVGCQGSGGKQHIIWLGLAAPDGKHNATVLRSAAMSDDLHRNLKRDSHPFVAAVVNGSVWRSENKGVNEMITRVIVEMDGEPLGHYFRMHFEKQCGPEQRVLTEELRWLILAIFTMIEAVHALGFFLVKVDLDCMAFNPQTQQAQLLHAGFGTIIETERVKYKSRGGPRLVNRLTTESAACAAAAKRGDASHSIAVQVKPKRRKGLSTAVNTSKRMKGLEEQYAAASGSAGSGVDDLFGGACEVTCTNVQIGRWYHEQLRNQGLGLIGKSDWFLRPADDPREGHNPGDPFDDAAALRAADMHQMILIIVSWLLPISVYPGPRTVWKNQLLDVVWKGSVKEAKEAMVALLNSKAHGECSQPAALGRFANFVVRTLRDCAQQTSLVPSASDLCRLPILSPKHEHALSDGGIRIILKVDALDDPVWKKAAEEALRKAGFLEQDLAQLRASPRVAHLKNEEDKGMGFWCDGTWSPNSFACWYVGVSRADGGGRYSVALQNGTAWHCDGQFGRELPVESVIEHGTCGAMINGEDVEAKCNMRLYKKFAFEHTGADNIKKVWIPMGTKAKPIVDAFAAWCYNPLADAGCNRRE